MISELKTYVKYKDLLRFLVEKDIRLGEKDMLLGYLWWILEPLFLMLVYWILVNKIFGRGGPDYPLFLLCGLIPFRAFSATIMGSSNALVMNQAVIQQIAFPRVFLCLSGPIANHIRLIFGFLVIIIAALFFGQELRLSMLLLLFPLCLQLLLCMGIAMIFSIITVYFRDFRKFLNIMIICLRYFSPILYPVEWIPEHVRGIYMLNPLAQLMTSYRQIIMGSGSLDLEYMLIGSIETLSILLLGYLIFQKYNRQILKYL